MIPKKMRWVEHVAYLGGEKLIQEFGGETPKGEKTHLEDQT